MLFFQHSQLWSLSANFFSSTISGRLYQQKKALRFGQLFWDQSVSRVDLQYSQKGGQSSEELSKKDSRTCFATGKNPCG